MGAAVEQSDVQCDTPTYHLHLACGVVADFGMPPRVGQGIVRRGQSDAAQVRAEPGIVMVLHPYGKDLKVNYHLHVLITEGGLTTTGVWESQAFLNYGALRKIWQYECLTALQAVMPRNTETAQLIDRLFRTYPK